MKNGTKGAVIASAVAALFLAAGALAQDSGTGSGTASGSASSASAPQVKCVGGNDCKGHSGCKSAENDCKGKNACKGKGFVMTMTSDECTSKGGKAGS